MAISDIRMERFRNYRMPLLLLLVVISILLEIVLHWYLGISVAFSHFFYIPVILAAVWYGKRAVVVAMILGIVHLAGTYFSIGTPIDTVAHTVALLRAMMFIVIAFVLGVITDRMKKEQEQIINKVTDAAFSAGLNECSTRGMQGRKSRIPSFASVKTMSERRDIPGLIWALKKRDQVVQYQAAEALGNIGDALATEALMDALTGDQYSGIRWKAAEALGKIGAPAVPHLIQALKNPDEDVKWKAAVTLGEIGDLRAAEPLVDLLGDEDRFVRSRAAYALGLIGSGAVAPLTKALLNGSIEVRRGAAAALGTIRDPNAVEALIQALSDPVDEVWQDVIGALSLLGELSYHPLVNVLRSHERRSLLGAALALAGSGAPEAVRTLTSAIETADPATRPVLQSIVNEVMARQNQQSSRNGVELPGFSKKEPSGSS